MKIDTSKIEGYEAMTAEEKLAALEGFEYDDLSAEVSTLKGSLSKANSEAAEWKRKHNALLSDEDKRKQQAEDELKDLRAENEKLKTEKTLALHKSSYIALGYDESLAADTAQAIVDGDMAKVFANQKLFQEKREKDLKTEFLKGTPEPPAGGSEKPVTKEDLRKMSPQERFRFSQEHPEEYKEIYGGKT